MIKRLFETLFIIGLFGLVSTAINYWLSGVWVVVAYLGISLFTAMVLYLDDKEKRYGTNRTFR
jgi:uncharacterized membrane protein